MARITRWASPYGWPCYTVFVHFRSRRGVTDRNVRLRARAGQGLTPSTYQGFAPPVAQIREPSSNCRSSTGRTQNVPAQVECCLPSRMESDMASNIWCWRLCSSSRTVTQSCERRTDSYALLRCMVLVSSGIWWVRRVVRGGSPYRTGVLTTRLRRLRRQLGIGTRSRPSPIPRRSRSL